MFSAFLKNIPILLRMLEYQIKEDPKSFNEEEEYYQRKTFVEQSE